MTSQAMPQKARLGRYALWQLRDYALGSGGATLVVVVLIVLFISSVTIGHMSTRGTAPPIDEKLNVAQQLLQFIGWIGSVAAVNGLISNDRSRGWYRFALAKPVVPWRFYAQAFLLRGVGLVAIAALYCALLLIAHVILPLDKAIGAIALQFVLFGGVTLLLSTVMRGEWLIVVFLYVLSSIALGFAHVGAGPLNAWRVAHWVLPPFQVEPGWPQWVDIAWPVGYGILAIGLAMYLLGRREWGR